MILIPGIKKNELRLVPIQDGLRPWLEELRLLARPDGGPPDDMAFVFPTNRRRIGHRPNVGLCPNTPQ